MTSLGGSGAGALSDCHDHVDNGPLELLQSIQQFNLGISVPNIVLMLQIF